MTRAARGPSQIIPMLGLRFGRWQVIGPHEVRAQNKTYWNCRCDCGATKFVPGTLLRRGESRSCGCLRIEALTAQTTIHGHSSKRRQTPTFNSWQSMRSRCLCPTNDTYPAYGGAGISVCERWNDFTNFLADMGERPEGTTLDRYPNGAGNYEPGNCRWATKREQALNRKSTVWAELNGERKCLKDWARQYGVCSVTVRYRLLAGSSLIDALTRPTKRTNRTPARSDK